MFKKIINGFIDHPLLTSLFVTDFGILLFHRPPFLFSLIMLGGLMTMCMYFGQKLALFKAWLPLKAKELLKPGHHIKSTPGFLRRLAAQIYDFLLLIALLFIATALLLPFTSGEAVISQQTLIYRLYLTAISFFFYGWFWTHGGQTLGLRAWKIKVLTLEQKPISWTQALLRFATAIISWVFCGLGFLWILIDKNKLSWHDHLSKTAVFFDS
jgi:uncharacterized RDD family membrane protein YckC